MNRFGYTDETSEPGGASTPPARDRSSMRSPDMTNRSTPSPTLDAAVKCPLCDSIGWPSSLLTQGYSAECGSAWDVAGFVRQSPACHTISALRMEIATLQMLAVAS